jgi:hypothetical protein
MTTFGIVANLVARLHAEPGWQLAVLLCGLSEFAFDNESFVRRHHAEIDV